VSDLRQAVKAHEAREAEVEQRARDLIVFAESLDDVGLHRLAGRCRVVAGDCLRLCVQVAFERTARVKIQADRDRCLALLADRAGQTARRETR
jgi:hypothetical protein